MARQRVIDCAHGTCMRGGLEGVGIVGHAQGALGIELGGVPTEAFAWGGWNDLRKGACGCACEDLEGAAHSALDSSHMVVQLEDGATLNLQATLEGESLIGGQGVAHLEDGATLKGDCACEGASACKDGA